MNEANPIILAIESSCDDTSAAVLKGKKVLANKTATQSRIDATGESSILSTIADNVSEAMQTCIQWCGQFMGVDAEEATYTLNKKFFDDDANPQLMMAAIQLNDRGIIAKSDMQDFARAQGLVKPERSNEDIDGEVEVVAPI